MRGTGSIRNPERACAPFAGALSRMRDREVCGSEREALQEHLRVCAGCRRAAQADRLVAASLQTDPLDASELPSGEAAAAWILNREPVRRGAPRRFLAPGLALGLAALVAFAGQGVLSGRGSSGETAIVQAPHPGSEEPLPALVIVDDERSGRQVMLAPAASP
jgi:hypothetical protein